MIKNFIYLDEQKMYSLSSQIFEGVTEYIVNESVSETSEKESQKGPIGSGKVIGDILRQNDKKSEKKFLHDHSYSLLEQKLTEDKKILEFSREETKENLNECLKNSPFVKVKAKAIFNDIVSIQNTIENFNKFGKALTRVTNHDRIVEAKEKLKTSKTHKKKGKIKEFIDTLAKESGLENDQSFLDDLSFLLKFGFQDQLEIQMNMNDSIFSANLKRECLREEESLIIRKYSRQTEVEFILFGIVTQHQENKIKDLEEPSDIDDDTDTPPSIKQALMNLVSKLTDVETSFTGRLDNEIIIDPIALYREL